MSVKEALATPNEVITVLGSAEDEEVLGKVAKIYNEVQQERSLQQESVKSTLRALSKLLADKEDEEQASRINENSNGLEALQAERDSTVKHIEKLEAAVGVLAKVVARNPYESEYQKTIADVYGVLARNQRDGGRSENAVKLEQEAISILQPIIRENEGKVPTDVLYSYSQRLAHLAELLGDGGAFDESRAPLEEAISVLELISKENMMISQYQRALARARGLAGFACIKSGKESEAKEHLQLAKLSWQTYMEGNPDDPDAEQAVKWASDQLDLLQ